MNSHDKNLVIVRSVVYQGLSPTQAATRFGVSRQWVHTLLRRYEARGDQGLAPGNRAPKSRPGTTVPVVRQRVIELRVQLSGSGADAGPETIAWHLQREGHHVPSTSTIRRILHAQGLIVPDPKKRPKSSYIRFEADLPNGCWQADITHWFLADGTRVEILDFLDDHSRYLLYARAAPAFSGPMVTAALQSLIDEYGPPASTLTDNGLVFTARLAGRKGGRNGFEKLLQAHQIRQKNGHPGHPQTQARSNASTKPSNDGCGPDPARGPSATSRRCWTPSGAGTTTNDPTDPPADAPPRPRTRPCPKQPQRP